MDQLNGFPQQISLESHGIRRTVAVVIFAIQANSLAVGTVTVNATVSFY